VNALLVQDVLMLNYVPVATTWIDKKDNNYQALVMDGVGARPKSFLL